MIRLLRAEVLRVRSRRFTLVTLLLLLLAIGAFQIQVYVELRTPPASEVARAQIQFEQSKKEWDDHHEEWAADCVAQGLPVEQCTGLEPKLSDYMAERIFSQTARSALQLAAYLSGLGMFLAAASFIGAEFTSGSIGNWLSFVPRRHRVYLAKLLAVVGFALTAGIVFVGGTLVSAMAFAAGGHVPHDKLSEIVSFAARGLAVPVVLAVLGFAIGLVTRHTAAAIGVLLGYLALWFVRNAVLGGQAWAQELTPWSPEGNMAALVEHGTTYEIPKITYTANGTEYDSIERHLSFSHGLIYIAAVVVVAIVVSAMIFRRRDVN